MKNPPEEVKIHQPMCILIPGTRLPGFNRGSLKAYQALRRALSLVPLTAAAARYGCTHGPGGPWGRLNGIPGMKNENLIQQWIDHCTPRQRVRLANRIQEQLAAARYRRMEQEGGPSPTQIMSTVLFVECATDLDLQPLELHGLMCDPREQSLEAVVNLAMMQLSSGSECDISNIESRSASSSTSID